MLKNRYWVLSLWLCFLLVVAVVMLIPREAESASTYITINQSAPSKTLINNQSLDSAKVAYLEGTQTYGAIIFEVRYTNVGGGTATGLSMTCKTCGSDAPFAGGGCVNQDELSLIVSTSPAGLITTVEPTWFRALAGVNKRWTWTVSNPPGWYLVCTFTGTTTNFFDHLTVLSHGVTP